MDKSGITVREYLGAYPVWLFGRCPNCGGNMYLDNLTGGKAEYKCLQCGRGLVCPSQSTYQPTRFYDTFKDHKKGGL